MVVRAKDLEINFLCGHWGPWKVLEQNSPNDLGCDRLAKGLDDNAVTSVGCGSGAGFHRPLDEVRVPCPATLCLSTSLASA